MGSEGDNGLMPLTFEETLRIDELIEAAKDQPSLLSQWENDFMQGMIESREKYGNGMRISEKQWAVLDKIAVKLAL